MEGGWDGGEGGEGWEGWGEDRERKGGGGGERERENRSTGPSKKIKKETEGKCERPYYKIFRRKRWQLYKREHKLLQPMPKTMATATLSIQVLYGIGWRKCYLNTVGNRMNFDLLL